MRACIITHDYAPGEGAALAYMDGLVKSLATRMDVLVVTISHRVDRPEIENSGRIKVYRFPTTLSGANTNLKPFEMLLRAGELLEIVAEREEFDILHSEHLFPMPLASRFCRLHHVPHIGVIEGISKETVYSKIMLTLHRLLLPLCRLDTLVVWSRFLEQQYARRWGIKTPVAIIPGGIDTALSRHAKPINLRKLVNIHGESVILFSAKPLYRTNYAGVAAIIASMPEVTRKFPQVFLIVAGAGRMRGRLQKLASSLKLQNTAFVGWVSQKQLPSFYAGTDIIVNCITYPHAGSITLLESMAIGKPLVTTAIQSLPGKNGLPRPDFAYLAAAGDVHSLSQAIISAIANFRNGATTNKAALEYIKKFEIKRIAAAYERLYRRRLGSKGRKER